jgi:hypothetical protein
LLLEVAGAGADGGKKITVMMGAVEAS